MFVAGALEATAEPRIAATGHRPVSKFHYYITQCMNIAFIWQNVRVQNKHYRSVYRTDFARSLLSKE